MAVTQIHLFPDICWDIDGLDILELQLSNMAVPYHAEATFLCVFQQTNFVNNLNSFVHLRDLEEVWSDHIIPNNIFSNFKTASMLVINYIL